MKLYEYINTINMYMKCRWLDFICFSFISWTMIVTVQMTFEQEFSQASHSERMSLDMYIYLAMHYFIKRCVFED